MKVRIETYQRGPTEIRVRNIANSSAAKPSHSPTLLTDNPEALCIRIHGASGDSKEKKMDAELLKLKMDRIDQSAWNLFEDFKNLDRIVQLSREQEYPPVHLLNRINIRLRGLLERSEAALEAIEDARKPIMMDAAE